MTFAKRLLPALSHPLARLLARRRAEAVKDALTQARLNLPICNDTPEETTSLALFQKGRDMARQSAWEDVTALILRHDLACTVTDAGTPHAELLMAGASADMGAALKYTARHNALSENAPVLREIEDVIAELTTMGPGGAALASHLLISMGWAFYDQGAQCSDPIRHIADFKQYLSRADAILTPHLNTRSSATLASCACLVLAARDDAALQAVPRYERLIRANPHASGHLRSFGLHLLPQWFGTHPQIDVQARRMAVATRDVWGLGGYTWVWMDALALDPESFASVDVDFYLEGLDHILTRCPSQHIVNLFSAFLTRYLDPKTLSNIDESQHRALSRRRAYLMRARLEEVHPWVWASGPQNDPAILKTAPHLSPRFLEDGARLADAALAAVFDPELRATQSS